MLELLRPFRNIGWFFFGVLLAAVPILAFAETIVATSVAVGTAVPFTKKFSGSWAPSVYYDSVTAACDAARPPYPKGSCVDTDWGYQGNVAQAGACYAKVPGSPEPNGCGRLGFVNSYAICSAGSAYQNGACMSTVPSYSCPTGKNWTLSGTTCTRPDCTLPQTLDPATGLCSAPSCKLGANVQAGSTRYAFPNPQPSGVTWCVNDCEVYPNAVGSNIVGSTRFAFALVNGAGGSASTCSAGASSPSAVPDPTTTKTPPCAVGDGSLTTADGTVKCVPSITPGATVPPIQSSSSSKQTFPDGSSTTTTTTNTCTGDGACSSTTTTTNTANSAGTQGAAGPVGTGTQQNNKKGDQPSDFCAQNPSLQICKGGISEEATQKKILTEIETLTKPKFDDDSALKNAGKYEADQATKDLNEKDTLAATGGFDPIGNDKTAMMQAMESGWFTPIPRASCQPMGGQVGPYNWKFDLCPIAAKISEIGAYAMWFMLAWGTFLMITGARREG